MQFVDRALARRLRWWLLAVPGGCGMATAKGIAFAAQRPLWAVSSLAALAAARYGGAALWVLSAGLLALAVDNVGGSRARFVGLGVEQLARSQNEVGAHTLLLSASAGTIRAATPAG